MLFAINIKSFAVESVIVIMEFEVGLPSNVELVLLSDYKV